MAMVEVIYRVIAQTDGIFHVEISKASVIAEIAINFTTQKDADEWIANSKRLREGADPRKPNPHGRWGH